MTRRALASLDAQRVPARAGLRTVRARLQVDGEGRIIRSRPGANGWSGDDSVVGTYASDLFVADDALAVRALLHRAARGDSATPVVLRMRHTDGTDLIVRVCAYIADDAISVRVRECDPTEKHEFHSGVTARSRMDPLTGLPDNFLLKERIAEALETGPQTLVLIDLDRFRHFVTALGRRSADRILVEIADRLVAAAGPAGIVGRSTGQFAMLVPGRTTSVAISSLIARIRTAIGEPFSVNGDAIILSACLGVATSTADAESLFADAEVALAQAKATGAAHDSVFDPAFRLTAVHNVEVEGALSHAVADHELQLDFQPIVHLETDTVVAYEALVRWQHPVRGRLTPSEFLDIAQTSGAGAAIDDWVLTEACRRAAMWARSGRPPAVCVNAAPERFALAGYAEQVGRTLAENGLDPALLVIEITEANVLADVEAARASLAGLRALGVRVALDDYGTGYSSLADVAALPVDELKIDRSFVAGLGSDRTRTAIVHAIVGLGHALGVTVVAEGIERASQAAALRSLGCHLGQGFFFGYPGRGPTVMEGTP